MSGRERGSSRISEMLDILFGNRRRTILIALGIAALGYVLFLIFGDLHTDEHALYRPLVMGVLSFAALFLVLGFQLINPFGTAKAMDFGEMFFSVGSGCAFVLWLVTDGLRMLFSPEAGQAATVVAEIAGVWCAVCVLHNMRK